MHARLLGSLAVIAALTGVAVVGFPSFAASAQLRRQSMAVLDAAVLRDLNRIRAQRALPLLHENPALERAAASHSREMSVRGYFEHRSANGTLFWRRIGRWYPTHAHGVWSVGENLLWASPTTDAQNALRLWMASPDHRRNILDPRWREVGVAAIHVSAAPGVYGRRPTTIITTDFGFRSG